MERNRGVVPVPSFFSPSAAALAEVCVWHGDRAWAGESWDIAAEGASLPLRGWWGAVWGQLRGRKTRLPTVLNHCHPAHLTPTSCHGGISPGPATWNVPPAFLARKAQIMPACSSPVPQPGTDLAEEASPCLSHPFLMPSSPTAHLIFAILIHLSVFHYILILSIFHMFISNWSSFMNCLLISFVHF